MDDSDASSARLTSVIQRLASARTRQDREAIVDELHSKLEEAEDKLVAEENKKQCAVISEILDARTRPLVSIASTTDYVTSNELVCNLG